jgi:hypothetical protein
MSGREPDEEKGSEMFHTSSYLQAESNYRQELARKSAKSNRRVKRFTPSNRTLKLARKLRAAWAV